MKVKYNLSPYHLCADIVSEVEPRLSVTVSRDPNVFGKGLGKVTINWGAYGSVKPEYAVEYADLLMQAVRLADQFQLSTIMRYKYTIEVDWNGTEEHSFEALAVCADHIKNHFESVGMKLLSLQNVGRFEDE